MKRKTKGRAWLFSAIVCLCLGLALTACQDSPASDPFTLRDLTAEVGYRYVLPDDYTETYSDFALTDPDGNPVELTGNGAVLDKLGAYTLTFDGGAKTCKITVADTEKPHFDYIWGDYVYNPSAPLSVDQGSTADLDEVFVAYDNGGTPTVRFEVYEAGANLIELPDTNVLTFEKESEYLVKAFATDPSGNVGVLEQVFNVFPASEYRMVGQVGSGSSSDVAIPIPADSDVAYEVGGLIRVTMQARMLSNVSRCVLMSDNEPGAGWPTRAMANAATLDTWTNWTEVTFDLYVQGADDTMGDHVNFMLGVEPEPWVFTNADALLINDVTFSEYEPEVVDPTGEFVLTAEAGTDHTPEVEIPTPGFNAGDEIVATVLVKSVKNTSKNNLISNGADGNDVVIATPERVAGWTASGDWVEETFTLYVQAGKNGGPNYVRFRLGVSEDPWTFVEADELRIKEFSAVLAGEEADIVVRAEQWRDFFRLHLTDDAFGAGDKVHVTFELKTAGYNRSQYGTDGVNIKLANGPAEADGFTVVADYDLVEDSVDDWVTVEFDATYLSGSTAPNNTSDLPGVYAYFSFYYQAGVVSDEEGWQSLTGTETFYIRNVVMEAAGDEPVDPYPDADYVIQAAAGSGSLATVDVPVTADAGETVTVTLQVKSEKNTSLDKLLSKDAAQSDVLLADEGTVATWTDWTTVTYEMYVHAGENGGSNYLRFALGNGNDPSYTFVEADVLLLKDVSVSLPATDSATLTSTQYGNNFLLKLTPEGYEVGDFVTVTFRFRTENYTRTNYGTGGAQLKLATGKKDYATLDVILDYDDVASAGEDWIDVTFIAQIIESSHLWGVDVQTGPAIFLYIDFYYPAGVGGIEQEGWQSLFGGEQFMFEDISFAEAADYYLQPEIAENAGALPHTYIAAEGYSAGDTVEVTFKVMMLRSYAESGCILKQNDGSMWGGDLADKDTVSGWTDWTEVTYALTVTEHDGVAVFDLFMGSTSATGEFTGYDTMLIKDVTYPPKA